MTSPPARALAGLPGGQYGETAFWLALEVLKPGPLAAEDPELTRRLAACQEHTGERLRTRDHHAVKERQ